MDRDGTPDEMRRHFLLRIERIGSQPQDQEGPIARFTHHGDDYTAEGIVAREAKGLVISHLEVDPHPGRAGLTAAMLRGVPVRDILAQVQAWLDTVRTVGAERLAEMTGNPDPNVGHVIGIETPTPRSGRAPLSESQMREVALMYLEETAPGKPRGAIKRMAERLNRPVPTVSRWVGRAREAGWLGPAIPGREGGEPGPQLVRERFIASRQQDGTVTLELGPEAP